ncbi:uncharacterized protein LOC128682779 isoform X2 [Plodia interpunctella]|uniref:uncharacterized protein LOC128682779 isoform X2 n=1 Tax=Plodia interpunctella TaxID=58824 RepID=UPI0023682B68|nr:uncharacterized protein LOC128682779 isoform X2 [Plodia interpunctella]
MERIILLITIHSCNILTHPVKLELPNYNGLYEEKGTKPKSLGGKLLGTEFSSIPEDFSSIPKVQQNKLTNQVSHMGCSNERLLLPLKYHVDDRLSEGLDNRNKIVNLPTVKQPYQNYKVLVATAPAGLELDEDNKPMTVYIVFNDENNYQSPLDLPSVYFVKKSMNRGNKNLDSMFLVDSNRTVTGLRSKEIEKFVKFRNKFTSRFHRNLGYTDEEVDTTSDINPSASTVTDNN